MRDCGTARGEARAQRVAAKFSMPFSPTRFQWGRRLEAFTEENARDPRTVALAGKVSYEVDPDNPYPEEYTGHVRVHLRDGRVLEERQPHLRGGRNEPLTPADVEEKFRANCAYGGWDAARIDAWLAFAANAFAGPVDLAPFRG